MSEIINTRNDIKEEYKWDLSLIYKNEDLWYEDFKLCEKLLKELESKKNVTSSAKSLLDYLSLDSKFSRIMSKLYEYAYLSLSTDTTNTKYQAMNDKLEKLETKAEEITSFFEPELLKLDYATIEKYYEKEKDLLDYQMYLRKIYRYKNNIFSENEEKIITTLSSTIENSSNNYFALFDSDMKFPSFKIDGKKYELNESLYSKYISSTDRRVRKKAFKLLYETISSYKNTIASMLSGHIDASSKLSKIRKFNSLLEHNLYHDELNIDIYNNVIKTVSNNLNVLFDYYDLKKEILKLKDFHIYDIYTPLFEKIDKEYSYEEAKEIVMKAIKVLGDKYVNDAKRAFSERWIDVYHTSGKRNGAFSAGCYDSAPYMLLNYQNKFSDISTLIHELGHSMHSYYSNLNNKYPNNSYTIFVAEIASTVNELLLMKYLIENTTDKHEKLKLLNQQLELFKGTIYRQTMFAEFEKGIYDHYNKEEPITHEYLSDYYYELNKKYFGNHVILDDLIKYEWMRIDHFFYNFYVYKYVIGLSCACYIVDRLNDKEYLEKYLKFLSLGGSMPPLEELKVIDIDLSDEKVIKSAINKFKETIEETKKIYQEVGDKHE